MQCLNGHAIKALLLKQVLSSSLYQDDRCS
jgi:hypothetical protein